LLTDGTYYLDAKMVTPQPFREHFSVGQAAAFQVIDQSDGQGARGTWTGELNGVVRPLLKWTNDVSEVS
jgi:lipopolysaccharide transport system ATP-binding protein